MVHQGSTVNQYIVIFPCAGVSRVGQLTILAVQQLVLEGTGQWFGCDDADAQLLRGRSDDAPPFIVVDGCEQHCARKQLEAVGYDLEFHLSLTDLGIEKDEFVEISDEELQLAKDAIVAESTRVSERSPKIIGGCGCR